MRTFLNGMSRRGEVDCTILTVVSLSLFLCWDWLFHKYIM